MVYEKIKRIEKLIFNSIEEINNQLPENQQLLQSTKTVLNQAEKCLILFNI